MTPAKEPVAYAGIASAIMAILGALVALNVIHVLPEQMRAIETAIGATLAILGPAIATYLARRQVTPLSDPKVEVEGGKVVPLVRADTNQPTPQAQARSMAKP